MIFRKLLKIIVGLLFFFVVAIGLTSLKHPIILKWLAGSARIIGKPIKATVYTNGQVNDSIKVFHVDKYWGTDEEADYYVLFISYADKNSTLRFFSINVKDNYAGRPVSTSLTNYDILFGYLFQSDMGGHFSQFQDDMKGYDFDPQLKFQDRQLTLKIPPSAKELKCDSLRVVL